ncbi:hypothetical protein RND71_030582 [Anisodus tanguticus]|uniref:Amino acid transporter transmembrane domain-containing protein n=1 Tax=Anisodus tanguticus TaxID=243964 RepID=A0AAE1RFI0_9SOLA|nr:hypothetical protein RND71_030582 [Anisodus tanguticus]
MAIIAIAKGKIVSPRMVPELNSTSSFFNLFTAIPVIVTAFAFHFNGKSALPPDVHGLSTRKDKIIAVVMIVLAVVTSIITIAANIYNMIGKSS